MSDADFTPSPEFEAAAERVKTLGSSPGDANLLKVRAFV
jgi:acyl-CoA-binding protein